MTNKNKLQCNTTMIWVGLNIANYTSIRYKSRYMCCDSVDCDPSRYHNWTEYVKSFLCGLLYFYPARSFMEVAMIWMHTNNNQNNIVRKGISMHINIWLYRHCPRIKDIFLLNKQSRPILLVTALPVCVWPLCGMC